jgi:hypothetical protein
MKKFAIAIILLICFALPVWSQRRVIDTILDEGTSLVSRSILNFTGNGITCTDDSANSSTNCNVTNYWTSSGPDIYNNNTGSIGIGTTGPFSGSANVLLIKSATLPSARRLMGCAENSATHKIYCLGGRSGSTNHNQVLEYDPATDTTTVKSATLPSARTSLSCAQNSATNKIYCFGGYTTTYIADIIEYTPATDTLVTKTATLPSGRSDLSCVEYPATHKIYCFGGFISGAATNTIVEYTPSTDTIVTKTATLPANTGGLSCAFNPGNSRIYCFGGYTSAEIDQIVEYNPATDTLVVKSAKLPSARTTNLLCATNSNINRIFCFGGKKSTTYYDQILEYNPATDTLVVKSAILPTERHAATCVENSATNKIYCFGGENSSGDLLQILEYTSSTTFKLKVNGVVRASEGFSTGDSILMGNMGRDADYIRGTGNLFLEGSPEHRLSIRGWGSVKVESGIHVPNGTYAQFENNGFGPPPHEDCTTDEQKGRIFIDSADNRLYICNGAARGWDFVTLSD